MDHTVRHCSLVYFEVRFRDLEGRISEYTEFEVGLAVPDSIGANRFVDTSRLQVAVLGFEAKSAGKA